MPATKFGDITSNMFSSFLDHCLPEHSNALTRGEIGELFDNFLKGDEGKKE